MEQKHRSEKFDTGLGKIRQEIKSRLVVHGLFGHVTHRDTDPLDQASAEEIEILVKGRTVSKTFSREDIEGCCLRVGGAVLSGVIAMVQELAG